MKISRIIGTAAVAGAILTLAPVGSAMAADTDATFELTAGGIDLTASSDATLTGGASGVPQASGQLGAVTVTDQRGGTAGWTVTATSDAFSEGAGPDSTGVSYALGAVTPSGTVTTSTNPGSVMTDRVVLTASDVIGNNGATFNPTLTVDLPSNALAGTYTGTVTTSVL